VVLEQLMDAGGDGDAGRAKGVDIAALVHRYGRSFVHSSPDVALEYYMQVTHNRQRFAHIPALISLQTSLECSIGVAPVL